MYRSSRGVETALDFAHCGSCTQRHERQKVDAMSVIEMKRQRKVAVNPLEERHCSKLSG